MTVGECHWTERESLQRGAGLREAGGVVLYDDTYVSWEGWNLDEG